MKQDSEISGLIDVLLKKLLNENNSDDTIFKVLKKRSDVSNNISSEDMQKRIQEFESSEFIVREDEDQIWAIKEKFIPIEIVSDYFYSTDNGFQYIIRILNNSQIEDLKKGGYGIASYKVVISGNFLGAIYCEGKHPNLEMSSSKFCVSQDIRLRKPIVENMKMIEESFTQAVLHRSFFLSSSSMISDIRKIIHVN